MSFESNDIYEFRDFHLDVGESSLLRNGTDVPITPKAFHLLQILVENHGRVVRKDELISRIWENSFVEEGNLAWNARLLRKVLDDDAKNPTFIETVPRKGYRFIADVSKCCAPNDQGPVEAKVGQDRLSGRSPFVTAILITAAFSVFVGGPFFFSRVVLSRPTAPILASPITAQRLTSTGNAFQAVISPNGKLAAYTDLANGKWGLWLRLIETAEHIQILPPSETIYGGLAFSQDGNSLYFSRGDPGPGQFSVYRVNTFGGVPVKILEDAQGWLSISPDDTKISFVRCPYKADDYCSLFYADVDGGNERKIVTLPQPLRIADNRFAPDGRSLAFAAGQSMTGSNDFGLYRVDLDTGRRDQITPRRFFNIKNLAWLPDGEGLLFSARPSLDPKFSIWKVDAIGATTQLTSDDGNFSGLSLDQKSETLLATKVDNDFAVYVGEIDNGVSLKLAAGRGANFIPGAGLVYDSPDHDIWTSDTEGSNKRQLTSGPFTDICPIPSPDGRLIFYSSNRSGTNQIWRMNVDGSEQRQLTQGEGGYPSFVTPDGTLLYYRASLSNSFHVIGTDGSGDRSRAEIDRFAGAFSPDGQLLAYFEDKTTGESTRLGVRRMVDQSLVRYLEPSHGRVKFLTLQWHPDGRSILYVTREEREQLLWRWRLDRPKPELLRNLGIEPVERIAVSPHSLKMLSVQGKWLCDAYLFNGLNNGAQDPAKAKP